MPAQRVQLKTVLYKTEQTINSEPHAGRASGNIDARRCAHTKHRYASSTATSFFSRSASKSFPLRSGAGWPTPRQVGHDLVTISPQSRCPVPATRPGRLNSPNSRAARFAAGDGSNPTCAAQSHAAGKRLSASSRSAHTPIQADPLPFGYDDHCLHL